METKTLLYILVTISACGGMKISEIATQEKARHSKILPRLQPPIWKNYEQNKVEFFQRHLRTELKDWCSQCVLSSKASRANNWSRRNSYNWASRKVFDKVTHIRQVTGKSDNLSETTPESLRKLLEQLNQKLPLQPQHPSLDVPNNCPPDEEFLPCQCDPGSKIINCSAVTSLNQLQELFHTVHFPIQTYDKFLMIQYEFSSAPNQTLLTDNLFGGVSFIKIVIENTLVESITAKAFAGSEETLEEISLQYNPHLQYFPFEQMVHFTKLQTLKIEGSSLSSIPVLSRVPHLREVHLNDNKITKISPMAFADLLELEVLDIGFNRLQTINANTLQLASPSVLVFLDHNCINSIEEEAFSSEQPALLDISNNCLSSLEETIFSPILDTMINNNYSGYVNAEENPLHCNDILWLMQNPTYLLYFLLSDPGCSF
ncbi:leucine-rich repeat-containing G-protein coupled receptor 5-like [Penaeus japonicus]|uniref:leucine-rich repeat-containing G-protein coupled receptor 5-like n=1 Tax=Penaeus japonicus TaxID=27405 RepID=UPI001C70F849|nr:leucine-rich repeat-containing G-protein coupled receptor 5-like [Penaeus japonicus]